MIPRETQLGLRQTGNIDLYRRPIVVNPDRSWSTVRSISISTPQGVVLIPTVVGNRVVSNQQAISNYRRTGQQLGIFDTEANAQAYAASLHLQQMKLYQSRAQALLQRLAGKSPI